MNSVKRFSMSIFSTKELIFIALMAALLFVLNFTVGAGIIAVTGIPGSSAFITGITNLIFITFIALVVRKFGVLSLFYFVYGIIALPTHMAGGPPGFIWKVPLLVISAFLLDILLHFTKFRKVGFIIGLPVLTIFGFGSYLVVYYLLGMPEFEKLYGVIFIMSIIFIVLGYIGMWLGFVLYNKMKNKRIIRNITY